MKWEVPRHFPRLRRVCWCIPLRRGIIALVYANLLLALLFHVLFLNMDEAKWFFRVFTTSRQEMLIKVGRTRFGTCTVVAVLLGGALAELVMGIVALVGLHRKNMKVIKAYLHYSLVYLAVIVLYRVVDSMLMLWMWEVPIFTVFLAFKVYYVITLRSQVKKMEGKALAARSADAQVELGDVPGAGEAADTSGGGSGGGKRADGAGGQCADNVGDDDVALVVHEYVDGDLICNVFVKD